MAKQKSRTQNAIINIAASLGGKVLSTILTFVVRTVFIHILGKQYLGINGLFSDILTMLSLTELGIDTALNFQLYKPLAEGDDKRVRILIKFYRQAYRVIGCVIMVIGLCLIPLLPVLIKDYESLAALQINAVLIFVLFLLQSVSSYLFFAYRSVVMKANQKKYVLDIADYAVTLLTSIAQIIVLVTTRSFVLFTAIVILFNILKNFVNGEIARRYYPQFFVREPDSLRRDEVIGLFKDCGALFVYKLNNVVLKATDNLVLSTFLGLAAVGLYSNYLLFYTSIKSFLNQIYNSVKASMGNLFATGEVEKKYRFFQVMNYLTMILYGTAGVGIAICGNELISVWIGEEYVIPQPFPLLIGIEILFHGLKQNLGQIRHVSGIFRKMWFRPVMGILINIAVSVALVQVWGIYGVITGTILSDLLTNFLVDPVVIHRYSFDNYRPVSEYYKRNLCYIVILAAAYGVNLLLSTYVLTGHRWISVIAHILFVMVTVPGFYALCFYRSQEFRYLFGIVKRIGRKIRKRL